MLIRNPYKQLLRTRHAGVLPNGMRYVVDEALCAASTACGLWVNAGARDESAHEAGSAHLIEHLCFKSAAGVPGAEIVKRVEGVGGNVNAETSHDYTSYYAHVLNTDVELALSTLADLAFKPDFYERHLDLEKQVVVSEIAEASDDPDSIVADTLQHACFGEASLGRSILGQAANITDISLNDLAGFHGRYYRPENIVVAVSGGASLSSVVDCIERVFGAFQSHGDRPDRDETTCHPRPGFEFHGERRFVEKDLDQSQLGFGWVLPFGNLQKALCVRAVSEILGGGMASRLFQHLREEKGLVYSVDASIDRYVDGEILNIYAAVDQRHTDQVAEVVLGSLKELASNVTHEEVARAKSVLKANFVMAAENPMARIDANASRLLGENPLLDGEEIIEAIDCITMAGIADVVSAAAASDVALAGVGKQMPSAFL
ncbi:MAG: pitrilysin family protein [Pseudomonadota bacterium]